MTQPGYSLYKDGQLICYGRTRDDFLKALHWADLEEERTTCWFVHIQTVCALLAAGIIIVGLCLR